MGQRAEWKRDCRKAIETYEHRLVLPDARLRELCFKWVQGPTEDHWYLRYVRTIFKKMCSDSL